MKMDSKQNFSADEDQDATLVTPRFDVDEAETAQPVVPLAVVSGDAETYDAAGPVGVGPRAARRASWPLALVLVSALAGSVIGGAGLYLFQKSRQQQRPAASTQTEQTAAPDDAAGQTAPAPAAETTPSPSPEEAGALAVELPAEVAEVPASVVVEPERKEDKKDSDDKRDEAKRAADEREEAPPAKAPAPGPVKRGKKGERDNDDDNAARDSHPRRVSDYPRESSDDDEEYYDRGGARRVGRIVYEREGRRERRRQRRQPAVDRVRGIFEGQP